MRAVTLGLPFLLACGGAADPPRATGAPSPAQGEASPASPTSTEPSAPLGPREPAVIRSITRVEAPRRAPGSTSDVAPPPGGGCAFGTDGLLSSTPGGADAVGLGESFLVAISAHTAEGGALVLLRLEAGAAPREVGRVPFATPLAPHQVSVPGLARVAGDRVAVAYVDGGGDLFLLTVDPAAGTVSTPRVLAEDVADTHSPPAVGAIGDLVAVAFTRPSATQKVDVVVVRGDAVAARYDVTPVSAGAASPAFVEGASRPMLTLVDPRAALSMAHALVFEASGRPSEPNSLQPIVSLAAPPRMVAALGPRGLSLLFVAHGDTNAAGIYLLDAHAPSIAPTAVVPPGGHGRLWVDALGSAYGADVVATTVPEGAPTGEAALVAFTLDAAGASPLSHLVGPLRVRHPGLARDDAGRQGVVFGTDVDVRWVPLACADRPG